MTVTDRAGLRRIAENATEGDEDLYISPGSLLALLDQIDHAEAQIAKIREVLASHPTPDCDQYPGGGDSLGSCGWKMAYAGVIWALGDAALAEGGGER